LKEPEPATTYLTRRAVVEPKGGVDIGAKLSLVDLLMFFIQGEASFSDPSFFSLTANLPPIEVQVPAPQEQENKITAAESNQNAQVSPACIKADGKRLVELVANAVRAVRAIRGGVVSDVACAAAREEGLHVIAASLTWGCGEQV
jgi:hypothetical protein